MAAMRGEWTKAETLKPGDRYMRTYAEPVTMVTILREREECKDLFGRAMFQFWASRSDTGAEGYVMFGPGGEVPKVLPEGGE